MPVMHQDSAYDPHTIAVLDITKLTWRPTGRWLGEGVDPMSRLTSTLTLGGADFHLDALEVRYDDDSGQVGVNQDVHDIFADYANAAGGDGPFETVEIEGREYAIFASPFCR